MEDIRKDSYNTFADYPELSYNCISYLLENNDLIWKLMYYPTPDAWNKTNLTKAQKGAMIFKGEGNESDYSVFMDVGQDNAFTKEKCYIRISPLELEPTNYIAGRVIMTFEVYSHYRINHMNNYKTRIDTVTQQFLEVFNGAEIGGLGRLFFDAKITARCKIRTIGQVPFKGKVLTMGNYMATG
jgi:hypothetical protein